MSNLSFGQLIRAARLCRDQTLSDVAGAVGISVAYLSRIERDRELPPKDSVVTDIISKRRLEPTLTTEAVSEDSAALAFIEQHGHDLRFCHDSGCWYRWDNQIWREARPGWRSSSPGG